MDSMADLMKKLGWIAWCLTVISWFLLPIISLLVNKLFVYLVFNTSKKLKELENEIIRELKKKLSSVEEQTVQRAAENKGSQSDLKILDSIKMDLKSALYEAEDILDLLDYRRIEKDLHLGDDYWVENQLSAACTWIARCKGSCFGRWIHVTITAVMKSVQSMIRYGQSVIQGWRHTRQNFELFCIRRSINNAGAAVLPGVLLPVSIKATPQFPCLESRGSVLVPADTPCGLPKEMVNEEEIQEDDEGEPTSLSILQYCARSEEEIEEEICEREVAETSEEEKEEESCEEVGERSEQVREEDNEEGKDQELISVSLLQSCARSMLTCFAKACFYRDWSYGIAGIKSHKKDASAVESLVPITERISLKNRIKCIEDILNMAMKSDLLNDKNSSSGTTTDKDKDKQSSSERKEIADMHRNIEHKVFGREKVRAHISIMLHDEPDTDAASSSTSKPYSVIGIYGITGSGKSTLAQYVCDYEKGAGHFNLIMFILVGKTFSMADIFCDMLEQIKQSRSSNDKDLKSLKTELCENLKNKRFLLVLDDVWVDDDEWKERDILLDTLNAALSGSRILVAAQKKDAAEALGAQEQISIPDLEEEVYLSLFMHHARPHAADDGVEFQQIGRKIANRLCRSPIAAVTVGKQLQRNKSIGFWETTANLEVLNKTMGALWWSYQQLGADVRRCFAYCSTFPKGYTLERDELVRIWIAQGFVNTRSNAAEELEDVGHRYCEELLTFSFLQGRRMDIFRKTETFTIHDLLHELAERVSGSEFFRIGSNDSPEDIPRGVHHLFIEMTNGVEIAEKLVKKVENLRTLIVKEPTLAALKCTYGRNHDSEKLLELLFMRLTKLRVLIIKQNGFAHELSVPECIDRMKHLRYLCLRFHGPLGVLILPRTFSKLYHIEIIDIPFNRGSRCPEDMSNLIYLRHIPDWFSFPNIGSLTSLQTMGTFKVKEEQGYGLKQLKRLNKRGGTLIIDGLGIVGSKEEALEAHLTHKERLRELELRFGRDKRFDPDVEAEVLEGLCPPKHLELLRIDHFTGSRYPSWMLSRQHPDAPIQLYRLELWYCSSQLASIPEDSKVLIGLRQLQILRCGWDRLPENMERLVSLQSLDIWHCDEIELLPTLPHQCLNNIIIFHCRMLSKTCKLEGHDNWHKIKHIPVKLIE